MNIPFDIIASIVGTLASTVGVLILKRMQRSEEKLDALRIDVELIKLKIIQSEGVEEIVKKDHDRLVRLEARQDSFEENDQKEKRDWFNKVRDIETKIKKEA